MVRTGRARAWLGALLVAVGCTDTGSDIGGSSSPTLVSVEPQLFLGEVPCSKAPGGMQTYVATVTDHGAEHASPPFVLPSSPPTPCAAVAQFLYVVPGHQYTAEIDGYDVGLEPGQIQPRGCKAARDALAEAQKKVAAEKPGPDPAATAAVNRLSTLQQAACSSGSGARRMERPDGTPLEPRWTWKPVNPDPDTKCDIYATSIENEAVALGGCESLDAEVPSSATAIAVDPSAALGSLFCKSKAAKPKLDPSVFRCGPSLQCQRPPKPDANPSSDAGPPPPPEYCSAFIGGFRPDVPAEHTYACLPRPDACEADPCGCIGATAGPGCRCDQGPAPDAWDADPTLTCVGGDVATFDVLPANPAWTRASGIACGATPPPYTEGVEPGQTYEFRIAAHVDANGPVTWASHCFTVAEEGLTVGVTCNPLTDRGELSVFPTEVGLDPCPKGGSVRITLGHVARPLVFRPLSCKQPAVLVGVSAGDYSVSIDLVAKDGASVGHVTCSVRIVPDATVSPTDCKSTL